jgi:hypothetical protein
MSGIFKDNVLFDGAFLQLQAAGEGNKNTKRVAETESLATICLTTNSQWQLWFALPFGFVYLTILQETLL